MGHPPRPDVPGATYHIASRGSNKDVVFFDDEARDLFLELVSRSALRYGWIVLAYCLMTNHYHLVLKVPLGGLSAGMRLLNGGFSLSTNRRLGRSRHLFANRFSSAEITTESHLLEALRYVVLNPVRAGLCESPEDWEWSSYRSCAGLTLGPPFLCVSEVLGPFNTDPRRAEAAYRDFVAEGQTQVSDTVSKPSRAAALRST